MYYECGGYKREVVGQAEDLIRLFISMSGCHGGMRELSRVTIGLYLTLEYVQYGFLKCFSDGTGGALRIVWCLCVRSVWDLCLWFTQMLN